VKALPDAATGRSGAVLLIRNIGELCTCAPGLPRAGAVPRAALVAVEGAVVWCGPGADLPGEMERRATTVIDAGGGCVIPGFVDAHTHLVSGGSRAAEFEARREGVSYEEMARRGGGIASTVRATAAASDEELLVAAAGRAAAALATGTTTLEVKTGYGLEVDGELRLLGLIEQLRGRVAQELVATLLPLHALPSGRDRDAHVHAVISHELPAARGRAEFCDVFCDRGAFSTDECERVLRAAAGLGFGLKLHGEQLDHTGAAMLAARLGAVSVDHLEHAHRDDAAALASAGTVGVLLPGANLSLGGVRPDARMMLAAGMELALATDSNPGTSQTTDMRLMVALGVGLFGLTPAESVVAATRGGAAALRRRDRGTLGAGKRCDLVILECETHVDLAYRLGGVRIARTLVGGVQRHP
jgi:imidazolonepropionase